MKFSKTSYDIGANQLICKANQLTCFYMVRAFTERSAVLHLAYTLF